MATAITGAASLFGGSGGGASAIGAIGSLIGGQQSANAAKGAAQARERQAAQNLAGAQADRERGVELATSPQEIQALEKSLAQQEKNIAGQEKLFEALDPAILEASSQALGLLRGEESKALAPLKGQRDRQRQQLVNTLREQLGPGAETSSAGIQALTQFDAETSTVLGQAQQQSLGQLFGMGQSGAAGRSALGIEAGRMATIGGAFGAAAGRASNAFTAGSAGVNAARGLQADTAGSQFAGQALQGQMISGIGKQFLQGGLTSAFGDQSGDGGGTNTKAVTNNSSTRSNRFGPQLRQP